MKRKSVHIRRNIIKSQNTLEKFGIFKKVNILKNSREAEKDSEKENDNVKNIEKNNIKENEVIFIKKEKCDEDNHEDDDQDIDCIKENDNKVCLIKEKSNLYYANEKDVIRIKRERCHDKEENEKRNDNIIKTEHELENDLLSSSSINIKMEMGKIENNECISEQEKKKKNDNKNKEINKSHNNLPLHKIYEPIYKEDFISEIRSKKNPLIAKILDEDLNFNLILCGPPGSGKSSLVNVIKNKTNNCFISLFHLNNLNNELKKVYDKSVINYKISKKKSILCIKDINRLNKSQQENLLLILKKGYFYLLATCLFNPMNILNASLSSRCLYLYLNSYEKTELELIIKRITNKLDIQIEEDALNLIMNHSCGDARVAINIIDFAVQRMNKQNLIIKEEDNVSQNVVGTLEEGKKDKPHIQFIKKMEDNTYDDDENNINKDNIDCNNINKDNMDDNNINKDNIDDNNINKDNMDDYNNNNELHNINFSYSNDNPYETHPLLYQNSIKKNVITLNNIKEILQNFPSNDDKLDHYNFISGLHKSIRAGNVKAAILYLMKSLKNGEDPIYICRRLIRIASEDIGLANHDVLSICINTHYACKAIGMPECQTSLIYAVMVLCKSAKSNYIYLVENTAKQICNEYNFNVPFHLRNSSNKYIYTNQPEILSYDEHVNKYKDVQKYLPDYLENLELFPEI
ncbi:DNA helicase, putative [Plasmodium sp. gorilla clade G2]|uniref:DNA helicase, putative n=1 Tax=Plasmodium sp. gorilla clade G2 TaxID=880535 RepID=UPI000D2017E5|nr:DNA helicase, putative [Plasmodium sp. gorilla clade G2]SOV15465.1 DNA helicase, putative [Plasmodium sp. gorilla clade G2]